MGDIGAHTGGVSVVKTLTVKIQTVFHQLPIRKLILFGGLLLGLLFIFLKIAELQTIVTTFEQGDWHFILLAVAVESIWMISVAVVYRLIYRSMGIDESISELLKLSTAANFLNIVAPTGVSGLAVWLARARQRGYSQMGVVVTGYLFVMFDYFSFLCFLVVGLLILFERQELETAELVASSFLLAIALGMVLFIYLGLRSSVQLQRISGWAARQSNRFLRPFFHREILSEERAMTFASQVSEELSILKRKPRELLMPVVLTVWTKALLVAVLFLMFLTFNISFSIGTVIAAFSMGYLFMIVSPTPGGVGVIEGALPLVLNSLHIPLGSAAVVALSYRGITFWLPLFFGMLAFRWLSHHKRNEPA
jgi:uncharacterized protein (TIRG00374 family)